MSERKSDEKIANRLRAVSYGWRTLEAGELLEAATRIEELAGLTAKIKMIEAIVQFQVGAKAAAYHAESYLQQAHSQDVCRSLEVKLSKHDYHMFLALRDAANLLKEAIPSIDTLLSYYNESTMQ